MPGHGRPILGLEDVGGRSGRMVLPLALTSRLQTNTLRQVFTSLSPLVAHTRQRTLRTYARRLHERQTRSDSEEPQNNEVQPLVEDERNASIPLLRTIPPGLHPNPRTNPPGLHPHPHTSRPGEAVIDIETASISPEQFTSIHNAEVLRSGAASFVPSSSTVPSSQHSSVIEPLLLPATVNAGALSDGTSDQGSNGSDTSSDEDNGNNRNGNESVSELLSQFPEVRSFLVAAWQYLIFIFIILAKLIFDHFPGLVVVVCLCVGFVWSNSVVRTAASQHGRRPTRPLLALLVNLPAALFLLYYNYRGEKLFYTVLLLPPDNEGVSVGQLVWLVLVSDYVLKLVTVIVKALITLMPHTLLHYQNRGKYFLVVEMSSQLYRCLTPVQPWLCYLLDGYVGPRKVLGVLLSAAYMVCKGPDVVAKMRCFQGSFSKFLNSVSYGHTPTKAQLEASGCLCPICHDDFHQPTILRCKHIFCEACVIQWFDRERTCPMCRSQVADDPAWRDGTTTHHIQLF